jgi:hypothetical protein
VAVTVKVSVPIVVGVPLIVSVPFGGVGWDIVSPEIPELGRPFTSMLLTVIVIGAVPPLAVIVWL